MTGNEFTKQFFATFKPDITRKYIVTIYNLGNIPVKIGVLAGNLPFIGANNQLNINPFSWIIVGVILTFAGIIVLIAGIIALLWIEANQTTKHTQPLDTVCLCWVDRLTSFPTLYCRLISTL